MRIKRQIIGLILCLPLVFLTFFCAKKQLKDKQLIEENGENIFAVRYQKMVLITADQPFANTEEQWIVKFLIENSTAVYQTVARPLDAEVQILGIFDNINLPIHSILSLENKAKIIRFETPLLVDEEPESIIYTTNLNENIVNNTLVFELPANFSVSSHQVLVSYQKENFLHFILGKKQGNQVILPRFVPILTVIGTEALLEKNIQVKTNIEGLVAGKLHAGKLTDFYIEFIDQKSNDNLASWIELQNPYLLGKNNTGQKVIRDLKRNQDHFILDPVIWKDFADTEISIVFNQGVVAGIFEKKQYQIQSPEDFKAMIHDPKGFYAQEKDLIFDETNTKTPSLINEFAGKYNGNNHKITVESNSKAFYIFNDIQSLDLQDLNLSILAPNSNLIHRIQQLTVKNLTLTSKGFVAQEMSKVKALYGRLAHQVSKNLYLENIVFNISGDIELNFPKGVVSLGGLIGYVGGLIQDSNNFLVPYGNANSCILKNIQADFNNTSLVVIGAVATSTLDENTSNSGYVGGLIGEVRANILELENIQINRLAKASVTGGDASAAGGMIGFVSIAQNVKIDAEKMSVNKNGTDLILESVTLIERALDPDNKPNLAGTGGYIGRLRGSYGANFTFTNADNRNVKLDPCACTASVLGNNIPNNTRIFIGELTQNLVTNTSCVVKQK